MGGLGRLLLLGLGAGIPDGGRAMKIHETAKAAAVELLEGSWQDVQDADHLLQNSLLGSQRRHLHACLHAPLHAGGRAGRRAGGPAGRRAGKQFRKCTCACTCAYLQRLCFADNFGKD